LPNPSLSLINPGELPVTERKRLAAMVYLSAVAVAAGYEPLEPPSDFDSIDLQIRSKGPGKRRLEFQVKYCSNAKPTAAGFTYKLKKKNYDDLRQDALVPRYLFLAMAPLDIMDWMRQNERRMHLRRCGYWISLNGFPARSNASSVTIAVPRTQLMTPQALQTLMNQGALP